MTEVDAGMAEQAEMLRRARRTISNLKAVAYREHRMNQATRNDMLATIDALDRMIDYPVRTGCFVSIEPCQGAIARCRCGWEQHHAHPMSARDDAREHERNQPGAGGDRDG